MQWLELLLWWEVGSFFVQQRAYSQRRRKGDSASWTPLPEATMALFIVRLQREIGCIGRIKVSCAVAVGLDTAREKKTMSTIGTPTQLEFQGKAGRTEVGELCQCCQLCGQ